ncbi:hypothetical protein BJY00DRAFT_291206 [Aspergillus carlsbadensis]|nr:hypothetical protein BJY00DRAFT_291206 [Aspergillus carlsbadensis]
MSLRRPPNKAAEGFMMNQPTKLALSFTSLNDRKIILSISLYIMLPAFLQPAFLDYTY